MPESRIFSVRTNRLAEHIEVYDIRNARLICHTRSHVSAVRIANALNAQEQACTKHTKSGTSTSRR